MLHHIHLLFLWSYIFLLYHYTIYLEVTVFSLFYLLLCKTNLDIKEIFIVVEFLCFLHFTGFGISMLDGGNSKLSNSIAIFGHVNKSQVKPNRLVLEEGFEPSV